MLEILTWFYVVLIGLFIVLVVGPELWRLGYEKFREWLDESARRMS